MIVTSLDLIVGISSVLLLFVGYLMGVKTLLIYKKKKNKSIIITSLLFFALPTPWSAFTIQLISILLGKPVNPASIFYFFAWSVPILVISWVHLTIVLIKDKTVFKKILSAFTIIPGLLFFYYAYVLKEFRTVSVTGSIYSAYRYGTVPQFLIYYFGLLGLFFIFPFYLNFFLKSEGIIRYKTGMVALSVFLFTISAVVDSQAQTNILFLLFLRVLLLISLISLYLGYNTPEKIKLKYS